MTSAFYVKTLASKRANGTHQTFIRDVSMSSTAGFALHANSIIVSYCLAMTSTPMLKSPVETTLTPPMSRNPVELILCCGKAFEFIIQRWAELKDAATGIAATPVKLFPF